MIPPVGRHLCAGALTLLLTACGGGSHAAAPTPVPVQPSPSPATTWALSGRVTTQSGTPVSGATITSLETHPAISDQSGNFTMSGFSLPPDPYSVTINARDYLTRNVWVQWLQNRPGIAVDLISTVPPFDPSFYQQLTRNTYERPGDPDGRPLTTWPLGNPKIYLETVDDAGAPVDHAVLDLIEATIPRAVRDWTGGKRQVEVFERGTALRALEDGWIVVTIHRPETDPGFCGRASVGVPDGEITLIPGPACSCGGDPIPAEIIAHEVGHTMGFWHVSDPNAMMFAAADTKCAGGVLTGREAFHAKVAWIRPAGTEYPDKDPVGATPLARNRITIVN